MGAIYYSHIRNNYRINVFTFIFCIGGSPSLLQRVFIIIWFLNLSNTWTLTCKILSSSNIVNNELNNTSLP